MTDTTPSGALDAAATTAGTFGSTRGSGLARGKRQTGAAAPSAEPAKSDYKPTALEVITPKSEYRNPFASPEPENAPAEEPAKIEAPEAPVATIAPEAEAPAEEPAEERHEINILPPTEAHRPSVSWESSAPSPEAESAESRPTFRPERREERRDEQANPRRHEAGDGQRREHGGGQRREGGEGRFESRGRRHDPYRGQPRDPRDYPEEQSERPRHFRAPEAPAPKGFFAWLKSLFAAPAPAAPAAREHGGERQHDGQRRRRHRGGRGHGQGGGNPQGRQGGERSERSFSEGGESRGEYRGGEGGGNHRRRHRGGRGRDRGPRSEGQQGGGAI